MDDKGVTALVYSGGGKLMHVYFESATKWKTTNTGSCQIIDAADKVVGEVSAQALVALTIGTCRGRNELKPDWLGKGPPDDS